MAAGYKMMYSCLKMTGQEQRADMGTILDPLLLFYLSMYLTFFISFLFTETSADLPYCSLRRQFDLNGMHKPGDVILGGLFEVHYTSIFPDLTFTSEPNQLICQG